jgi:hypothetical protein
MKTYTAYFHTDAEYAIRNFKADTPAQALALARKFYDNNPSELTFVSYDDNMPVNEISIDPDEGDAGAVWRDEDLSLSLAARDLLAALEQAVAALNSVPRFPVPSLLSCSYRIAAICDKAIAKAKGGAA